ncbi:hypothetical protein [Amycolatopsis anabasis]|uniref:hypothetical protein n=1 Tax=Amycolatopsis anabasis TaxID=1840409 RepID=UPI00131C839A|nr:hypothetical protein [Amycolatopsis anabasis]
MTSQGLHGIRSELLDLSPVTLGELRRLSAPELTSAIQIALAAVAEGSYDDVQGQRRMPLAATGSPGIAG